MNVNVFRTSHYQAQVLAAPQPPFASQRGPASSFAYTPSSTLPHIGTLSSTGGYSMPFHGDPKILAFCPGEVRHRRRTSRQQLQVLEHIFTTDQKPCQQLRKKLGHELSMTPRAVQVWFQNRRAKEKNLDKKRQALIDQHGDSLDVDAQDDDEDDDERPNTGTNSLRNIPLAQIASAPSPPSSEGSARSSASDLSMLRRGSAPAAITSQISPPVIIPLGPPDAARRASLETAFRDMNRAPVAPRPSRLQHSVTAPATAAVTSRSATNINRWVNQTAAASAAAASTYAPRAPVAHHIPGPLPQENFSFGAPLAADHQQHLSAPPAQDLEFADSQSRRGSLVDSYSRNGSLADAYPQRAPTLLVQPRFNSIASSDDSSAPPMTRFTSFASSASGASNSTYYSTLATPDGWSRRSSVAGEFSNLMGGLQVGHTTSFNPATAPSGLYQDVPTTQFDPPQAQQMDPTLYHHHQEAAPSTNVYQHASPNSGYQGSPAADWSSPSHSDSTVSDIQVQQQQHQSMGQLDYTFSVEVPSMQEQPLMYAPIRRPSLAPVHETGSLATALGGCYAPEQRVMSTSSHSSPAAQTPSPASHPTAMGTPPTQYTQHESSLVCTPGNMHSRTGSPPSGQILTTPAHVQHPQVSVVVPDSTAYHQGYASQYMQDLVTPHQQHYGAIMQQDLLCHPQQQQDMYAPQHTGLGIVGANATAYSSYDYAQ